MLIDDFYTWLLNLPPPKHAEVETKIINFDADVSETPLKRTIVIDLTSKQYLGKFILWDDNSCFSELIEIHSGKYILDKRIDFSNLNEVKVIYKEFEHFFI